ncbi:MAG: MnhB domain-containing protein [Phycisphaeraceae bacterium]
MSTRNARRNAAREKSGRNPRKEPQSPVLHTVARIAVPLTLAVSVVIFFQGHNLPGGGFIAGVLAAAAGAMYLLAFGAAKAAKFRWWKLSVLGLLVSLITGTVPLLQGKAFMDHTIALEWDTTLPLLGHELPTAAFFDLGVYLIVLGTLMTIFVELALED